MHHLRPCQSFCAEIHIVPMCPGVAAGCCSAVCGRLGACVPALSCTPQSLPACCIRCWSAASDAVAVQPVALRPPATLPLHSVLRHLFVVVVDDCCCCVAVAVAVSARGVRRALRVMVSRTSVWAAAAAVVAVAALASAQDLIEEVSFRPPFADFDSEGQRTVANYAYGGRCVSAFYFFWYGVCVSSSQAHRSSLPFPSLPYH